MTGRCAACGAAPEVFLDFGRMPLANGFLAAGEFDAERFFDLRVACCPSCRLIQLAEPPAPQLMFNDAYPFFSSTSRRMGEHFEELALALMRECGVRDPFIVELGSNDGILLQHCARRGVRHLGVEPSANVAAAGAARGVRSIRRFFDGDAAGEILASCGHADAIVAANVMCHIADIHSALAGVAALLRPGGLFVFEDPYWGDILERTAYDQVYDEHAFYFTVGAVRSLVERHGMELVDACPQQVHGGSMRYTVAHAGRRTVRASVGAWIGRERASGLDRPPALASFRARVEASRGDLVALLRRFRDDGRRVVGYGATSKSTTVINYCGITPDLVECITDTTPAKHGKYSPGAHIPIRPHADFAALRADAAVLFAWNHRDEILEKERAFRDRGGKWILFVPSVRVLE